VNLDDMIGKIICGDARELIKTMPDSSIDCLVTSPPYWGLRDYGVENQLGLEKTFEEYIDNLNGIFAEVKRVLKPTGTCWVNLGDSYSGSANAGGEDSRTCNGRPNARDKNLQTKRGVPAKSQCCIPERFAIAMVDRLGWIKRNTIIWYKRNAMPASVKDRFTVDFESVFFFVKSGKYYFEQQKEPYTAPMNRWGGDKLKANGESTWDGGTGQDTYRDRNMRPDPEGRNKRCVWDINTQPFPEAHFAVFPPALVEPMIKAGCPESGIVLDPFMGSGTTAMVAKQLNRNFIGFEANSEYCAIGEKRLRNTLYNEELAL